MTAACINPHASLVTGHAYTLVDSVQLKQDGKVVHELFKMRNPWGKEKYSGPWNDHDP